MATPSPFTVKQKPLRVRKILLQGLQRTNKSVVEEELQDLAQAKSFEEIEGSLFVAIKSLQKLDIFKKIDVFIDKAQHESPTNVPEADVVLTFREKGVLNLNAGTYIQEGEGTVEGSLTLTNPLGDAEKVFGRMSLGHLHSKYFNLTYKKPQFLSTRNHFSLTAFSDVTGYEEYSSYSEKRRGGAIRIADYNGVHSVSLNGVWRDIAPKRRADIPFCYNASRSVLDEAYPSVKTSIGYTLNLDERDSSPNPTNGSLMRFVTELAGLGGDTSLAKAVVYLQKHYQLTKPIFEVPGLALHLASQIGAVKPFGNNKEFGTKLPDRLWLKLRGFDIRGVGPRASPAEGGLATGDALGGDVLYSASASLSTPVPIAAIAKLGFRLHVFANAGCLTPWAKTQNRELFTRLAVDTRAAIGGGLVFAGSFGRLEANYSWILRESIDGLDRTKRGQLGINVEFL